ncbi:hypothetical protein [Streptomyces sp. NPDC002553]|uniref:hypothetical protein n=1 Tax=Streptomyces sp. NPDC002553 TaxID=3154417 RepID=UPI00331BD084
MVEHWTLSGTAGRSNTTMGGDWAEVVHRTDERGRRRVVPMAYEVVACSPSGGAVDDSSRHRGP